MSLDTTVTFNVWPSFAIPIPMPVRSINCSPGSSFTAAGSEILSSVGASLTGLTVTSKLRETVSLPPPPSDTVTVIVAVPKLSRTGV